MLEADTLSARALASVCECANGAHTSRLCYLCVSALVCVCAWLSLAHGGGIAAAFLVLGLQGTGFGLFSTPNMARIMASLPREQSGLGSTLGEMARAIGMMGGMLVATAAVAWFCGNRPGAEDPAAFTRAMDALFWALAATTTLSLLLAVRDARAGGAAPAK